MAEIDDPPGPPPPRRRIPPWAALVLVALVALAGWGIAASLTDGAGGRDETWQACAERVDPPEAKEARVRESLEDDATEAAIERLRREDQEAQRRIDSECGERP